jgi:RHS repeat-associated protein
MISKKVAAPETGTACGKSSKAMGGIAAWMMILLGVQAGNTAVVTPERLVDEPPILTPANVKANKSQPNVEPHPTRPVFSRYPSVKEIHSAPVFGEPLVPIGGTPTNDENLAVASALDAFAKRSADEDTLPLTGYLNAHPLSPWSPSLLCNLGLLYYHIGRFSSAMAAWEKAWTLSKDSQEPAARALADKAAGELAKMNARLGRFGRLELLFQEIGDRNIRGSATEKIAGAKAGLWLMKNRPEVAFRCGPMALSSIRSFLQPGISLDKALEDSRSTSKGMSLTEIRGLASKVHLDLRMAKREPGAPLLLPAVVHWKVDHYAALLKQDGDRYLVRDPTFGEDLWVTRGSLDAEASGYFLVPNESLPQGWATVGTEEGNLVFGKGNTGSSDPDATGSGDGKSGGDQGCGGGVGPEPKGMPRYAFHSMLVSLNLEDIPVGTAPPRGPAALFKVTYNQREANQPANFAYANLGQKWTFDWLSYIVDDPLHLSSNVAHYKEGGGLVYFKGYDSTTHAYAPLSENGSYLVRVSSSPIVYERRLPDGGKEVFSVSDGETSFPRKIFLDKIFTPAGDSLTFTFDANLRIVSARDALGQVTTLSYELGSDSLKITKVTDPFGRYATFAYNGSGQLESITDVLGLTSEFRYGSGDFIDTLITPYGNTVFTMGESGTNRWLEATDPLGQKERLEYKDGVSTTPYSESAAPSGMNTYNTWLNYRSSYFWDKKAMREYPGNFTKAKIYHWNHLVDMNSTSKVLESIKSPLEGRVWYNYARQPSSNVTSDSMSALPSKIGRILDDGSTQLFQYDYNRLGRLTKYVDPLGRETRYLYDTNRIDLLSVRQKRGGATELLDTMTYNAIHQPLTTKGAAGQTNTYTYNSHGQLLTAVNPKGETTTYTYDSSGYLLKRQGHMAGDTDTYTYDGYGRVRTTTGPDGHTLRYDYDALDRVTKISHPDSTYDQFVYHNLDREKTRDRRGRWSKTYHNALQQPVAFQDPLLRITNVVWCACGEIKSLTDAEGNITEWQRDLQGRVTDKIHSDGKAHHFEYENTTSRLLRRTDAKGQISSYEYFKDNELKQTDYSNAEHPTPTVSFTYDSVYARIASMTDGQGTTQYRYKPVGSLGALQLDSVDGPWSNDVVTYTYDSLGRMLTRSIDGAQILIAYDSLGRMISDSNALGAFTYKYVGQTGRLDSMGYPNGQSAVFKYFNDSGEFRLQEIKNQDPGSALISKFQYTYDPEGQIQSWVRQFGSTDTSAYDFESDAVDQLTGTVLKNPNSGNILKSFSYAYDKTGNRVYDQEDSVVRQSTYNTLNQLLASQGGGKARFKGSLTEPGTLKINGQTVPVAADGTFSTLVDVVTDTNIVTMVSKDFSDNADTSTYRVVVPNAGNASYSYDANGNMIGDGTHAFEYDAENRITAIKNGSLRSEFQYDGRNRRIQIVEKSGGVVTSRKKFLWVSNVIAEERDSTGATVAKRYFDEGVKIGSAKYFYTKDHIESIRELTDSTGAVVARYDYDPYGNRHKMEGSGESEFGFTGHYLHAQSGLNLTKYRAYNADIGKWLSRDPIGEADNPNLYTYVSNNPVNKVDALGLSASMAIPTNFPWAQFCIGVGAVAGMMSGVGEVAVAAVFVGIMMTGDDANTDDEEKEHTKNKRPSTRNKHEKGRSRNKSDKPGGEKGDKNRPQWK